MGLLDKTNPQATRSSLIRHGIIWGAVPAIVYPVACIWEPFLAQHWAILLPLAIAFGVGIGALMEWQLDDGIDIYWIVLEAEEEFGVKIPEAEWTSVVSVGDLLDAVLASLRTQHPDQLVADATYGMEVWERLKALLVHQLGLKPEQVVKSARFYHELGL